MGGCTRGGGMSKSINGDIHFRDLVCCSATFDFLLINFSMIFCWSPTLFTQILPTGSQRVSQFQRHSHREFCLLSGISREVLARSRVGGNMIFICVQYSVFQVMADRRHQFQDHEILQVPHYHLSWSSGPTRFEGHRSVNRFAGIIPDIYHSIILLQWSYHLNTCYGVYAITCIQILSFTRCKYHHLL